MEMVTFKENFQLVVENKTTNVQKVPKNPSGWSLGLISYHSVSQLSVFLCGSLCLCVLNTKRTKLH